MAVDSISWAALGLIFFYQFVAETYGRYIDTHLITAQSAGANQRPMLPCMRLQARKSKAAKMGETKHDQLKLCGVALPSGSSALTIFAFVFFAVFPFWTRTWAIGHVDVPTAVRVALLGVELAAAALRYRSMKELGDYFSRTLTTQSDQHVIRTGPYRYVRHPGYAANMLLYWSAGVAIGENVLGLALTVAIFYAIWSIRILREEAMMLRTFPKEYGEYSKVTARLVPYVF